MLPGPDARIAKRVRDLGGGFFGGLRLGAAGFDFGGGRGIGGSVSRQACVYIHSFWRTPLTTLAFVFNGLNSVKSKILDHGASVK